MMKHIVFVNPIRNLQTVLKLGSISVFDKVINLCGLTAEKGLKLSKGPKKQNNNVKLLWCGYWRVFLSGLLTTKVLIPVIKPFLTNVSKQMTI